MAQLLAKCVIIILYLNKIAELHKYIIYCRLTPLCNKGLFPFLYKGKTSHIVVKTIFLIYSASFHKKTTAFVSSGNVKIECFPQIYALE